MASSYAPSAALKKPPYDLVNGIAPIGMINTGALIIAVNLSVKAASLKEFIELVPGYSHTAWNGMWAPRGTPKEIIARLNQALARILEQPEVQERLRADGREPMHSTPEEFGRVIARDVAKWSKVLKEGNIKID